MLWLKSYLTNREQYVRADGHCSGSKPINIGATKGSIMGPLLVLVYINDMSKCSDVVSFIHFADDTAALLEGTEVEDVCASLNRELDKVHSLLCANSLSHNNSKTFFMVFSNKCKYSNTEIRIREYKISQVDSAKYLGIVVDSELSLKQHVHFVLQKISASFAVLRRLSLYTPNYVLRILHLSLIFPYLMYGIVVWGGSNEPLLCKLRRLQDICV